MNNEDLIPPRLLANPAFREDLKALVSSKLEVLKELSEVKNHSDGFSRDRASVLQERTGIGSQQAYNLMRTAEYLYGRVSEENISVSDAVGQICRAAADIDLVVPKEHQEILEQILAYTDLYEKGRLASRNSVGVGPHFEDLDGTWTISYQRTRSNELIRKPVLHISIEWHDGRGNGHEAHFQLTEEQWEEFQASVENIRSLYSEILTNIDE